MITDDWKPRNSEEQNDGENRERRPFNSNRSNYGNNNQGGNYGRSDYRGNYNNRQQGSGNYNRQGQGNYERRDDGYSNRPRNNYDRPNYNNRGGGNYDYPQRSYDNQPLASSDSDGTVKKRRPRVGEAPMPARNTNYDSRPNNYDRDNNRGGGYQQRSNDGGHRSYGNNRPSGGNDNRSYGNNNRSYGNSYGNNNRSYGNNNSRPYGNNSYGNNRPQRNNNYDENSKYSFQKQLKYREENFDPNEPIRLNKYLANAGVCSRREADEFIKAGVVKVNGEAVSELGTKVKRSDQVSFHDQPIKLEHKVYILLNKPKNCVTTADDPQERLTVMDLVKTACHERIFPVGRLDRNTTGVLLLTNDGDLSSKLTHPKFLKKKIYHVWLDKDVTIADMQKLADGIQLEDGEIHADAISYVTDEAKDQVGIEIHSGRNRIVRRMFETLGYHVTRLDRVYFAGLTKKNLKRGKWRFLSEKEVSMLRMGAFE